MTTHTLRPNATTQSGGTPTGAATEHAALSDDSDSTYVTMGGATGIAELDTTTLGTAATNYVTLRVRGRTVTGTSSADARIRLRSGDTIIANIEKFGLNTSLVTLEGASFPVSLSQAQVDALQLLYDGVDESQTIRYYELYVDLVVAEAPTCAVTAPTGTVTDTNRPTVTWTYTQGSGGSQQAWYEVKVYTDAEIAGGGFDPDTTPVTAYESGVLLGGGVRQHVLGALATGDSYGVYVRTAQSINGVKHWSAWDSETFTIDVDTADVDSVTATAVDASAKITVTVARDTNSEAWDFIEVQRSTDSGSTWADVRGATYVDATGGADSFEIDDYETGNGVDTLYRARATRIVSDLPITGEWVEASATASWDSTAMWVKAPNAPTLNTTVIVTELDEIERPRRRGVFHILGAAKPIVVSDVESARSGLIQLRTRTLDERTTLRALLNGSDVILFHAPPSWGFEDMYASVESSEIQFVPEDITPHRRWDLVYAEVAAPADPDDGTS